MSDKIRVFQKKIKTMDSLKSIIKTMKILAAINIVSFEKSVKALEHYYESVELGLIACLMQSPEILMAVESKKSVIKRTGVVIFGSDQGMVGQFNDQIAEYAHKELGTIVGEKVIWPVGERVFSRLVEYPDLKVKNFFPLPNSISHISTLISQLLDDVERERKLAEVDQLLIFYNKPKSGGRFEPTRLSLLPIDKKWMSSFMVKKWPTKITPEVIDGLEFTFSTLIRQHLFTSIVKACAESLASENACRLASMQVAEKHIDEQLERQHLKYNQERQNRIDEELFDVVSGFGVITASKNGL
ncbi:MAG: F0F1 ATP synthase subunit gamma [Bacteriovoracaceae bacterium]|nr:F0F1 ATP synthase subunit gamma [Bacteriovoracaceae bacterium]